MIVSMGWGFGGQITVGASIDPEGLQTAYEIVVECPVGCGLTAGAQRATGQLPADEEQHEVTLDITGITPGVHAAGEAFWRSEVDVPAPPPGACPNGCSSNQPYETGLSQETIELGNKLAEGAPARQAAQETKAAQELAEQHAREAAVAVVRLAEEQATHKHQEEEQARAALPLQVCTVPRLHGDTLRAARHGLTHADCRLGHIHRPNYAHRQLHVATQSQPPGSTLLADSPISIRLRPDANASPATRPVSKR